MSPSLTQAHRPRLVDKCEDDLQPATCKMPPQETTGPSALWERSVERRAVIADKTIVADGGDLSLSHIVRLLFLDLKAALVLGIISSRLLTTNGSCASTESKVLFTYILRYTDTWYLVGTYST